MTPIDEKTSSDLKLAQARLWQRLYASDAFWNDTEKMYEVYERLLALRKKWQPLARRCEKNPLVFCESTMGRDWFEPPKEASPQKAQQFLKVLGGIGMPSVGAEEIGKLEGKHLLKNLQTLAMRPPGRKRLDIFSVALTLRQLIPPMRFHKICLKLNPAYATMTTAQKRSERERIRSGVERRKKASTQPQGSRNTPG